MLFFKWILFVFVLPEEAAKLHISPDPVINWNTKK